MDVLIFRLYGPLASWGEAAGETRPTATHPGRSAIIGLLAAALGIRRNEEEQFLKLRAAVQIAVKQLSPGSYLEDYHTTQVPGKQRKIFYNSRREEIVNSKKLNTILSTRQYRCDGLWVVAIRLIEESNWTLPQILEALLKPKFVLYLGRKSCPVGAPLTPKIVNAVGLKEVLDTPFLSLLDDNKTDRRYLSLNDECDYYWEGETCDMQPSHSQSIYDEPLSRARWQFGPRIEKYYRGKGGI